MALIKLNQKFINIDSESILTKNDTEFYFETYLNSSEKEDNPEITKFNTSSIITGDEYENLETGHIIPYTSIVYIKNTKKFWTHG
jgi:hypothetical protein